MLDFLERLTELGPFFSLCSTGTMPKGFLKGHTYGQAPAPEADIDDEDKEEGAAAAAIPALYEVQLVAGEVGLADWSSLGDLAKEEILRLGKEANAKAEELRTGAYREEAGRAAMRRSRRQADTDARQADAVLEEAAKKSTVLADAMELLASSIVAFKHLQAMVDAHIPTKVWSVLAGSLKKQRHI